MPEAAATAPATPPDLEARVRHWQEDLAVGEKEEQRLRRLVVHDDEFVPVFSKPCDSAPNERMGLQNAVRSTAHAVLWPLRAGSAR